MSNSTKWILEFTPSIKDSQDFIAYYLQNSSTLRKKYLIEGVIAGCIVLFVLFSCIYTISDISPTKRDEPTVEYLISLGMITFFLGLAVFIIYPENRRKQIVENLGKLYKEDGKDKPCKCMLSLSESEIRTTSKMGEEMIRWEAINKIVVNGDYVYLCLSPMRAIIIPKRAFTDDEQHNEFIESIKQIHAAVTSKIGQ